MEILSAIVALFVGVACGYLMKRGESEDKIKQRDTQIADLKEDARRLNTEKESLVKDGRKDLKYEQNKSDELNKKLEKFEEERNALNERIVGLEKQNTGLEKNLEIERKERRRFNESIEKTEENFKTAFENLGNQILKEKSESLEEGNKKGLENILGPLKKDIGDFKNKFAETDRDFSGKFGELKTTLKSVIDQTHMISLEANNLTKALKSDSKKQGRFGEFILENLLQSLGLRKDSEYELQKGLEGGKYFVDAIIHLPENRGIVIDAKVSLTAYDKYFLSEDEDERATFIKQHLKSVENHIKELSDKNYQGIDEIKSLDFVLMFILVCPSTLSAILNTIRSLWQIDKRNANAEKIAKSAGDLYDKFTVLAKKMIGLQSDFNKVRGSYEDTMVTLSTGKGNLVGAAQRMKELGARTAKSLPPRFVEESGFEEIKQSGETEEAKPI